MSFIEAQAVVDPTQSNIAPYLSLSHGESVGRQNIVRPFRTGTDELLDERYSSGCHRLDQRYIIILRLLTPVLIR